MRVSAIEGHRLWAPVYDTSPNPLIALECRVLTHLLWPISSNLFIDIACGTGRWATYLRQRGGTVFGIDLCAEMLHQAKQKQGLAGRLVMADVASLPFATSIADICLCSFAAGYFRNLRASIAEMTRVTARGGKVIISDLHPTGIAAGWSRSFRSNGSVYEIEQFNPLIEEFTAAADRAGLRLQMQLEVCLGDQERQLFGATGKEHLFNSVKGVPAVWIGMWKKA